MTTKQGWILSAAVAISILIGLFGYLRLGEPLHAEGFTYPKAARDLMIIETWSENEVWSFYLDLKCDGIKYDSEFEKKYPDATEFCHSIRRIWSKKYKKSKEKELNWELFNRLME